MKSTFSILLLAGLAWGAGPAALPTPPAAVAGAPRGCYAVLANGFSIRHLRRQALGATTRLWLGDAATGYVDVPAEQIIRFEQEEIAPPPAAAPVLPTPAGPPRLTPQQAIADAGARHQIDPDFIASVVRAESAFNPRAVSPKGAQGLMQLMPQTASQLGVADSFDPAANVEAGTRHLRELLLSYRGDVPRALAAYNAGAQRVAQYGGVPPYPETRAYVNRVIRDYNRHKLAAGKNPESPPARFASPR